MELIYAQSKGYTIRVLYGYHFNKEENVFKDYIQLLYKEKKDHTGAIRTIYKHLLNNLLGRFGLKLIRPLTKILNLEERLEILKTKEVYSDKLIKEDKYLLTFNPIISKDLVTQHGLDYYSVLKNERSFNFHRFHSFNKDFNFKDISIAISAMVTAYARVFMHKVKFEILDKGGELYYSDTDSLVIGNLNIKDLHSILGENLGEFKIEYEIKEGYFISNKFYALKTQSEKIVIVSKGVKSDSLTFKDFEDIYSHRKIISAKRNETLSSYNKGSVALLSRKVNLDFNNYIKREKLFDNNSCSNKLWVDTLPLNNKQQKYFN